MDEQTVDVSGASVFLHRATAAGAGVLYLHSVPTSSDDWMELLALTGGVAPDLPGFGRSAKPGHLDYTLEGYVTWVERLLDALALTEVTVVGHGWGAAIGLVFAQRHPARIRRLAIIDAVPLLPGFSWPGMARWWRRPGAGELVMGALSRRLLARMLRQGSVGGEAWTDARIDAVWDQFDQGTQRAILRLHRSVDERRLAELGAGLGELEVPALVAWGERDPWLPVRFADAYAQRLPHATCRRLPDAGHWPWRDQPALVPDLADFITGGA